ncbi:MAG: ATP phosphoribosyltransferase regulatory subunit [Limnobacter sp.]|nr:ATP phosphoribosyltransferase regulatory subunit [Limnobacter sp.]
MSAWLLPESVADVLPSEARRIEELRRIVLDRFRVYGYELVMPPILEYTESLLSSADSSLDLQTFKLLDQASGRMLGLRADTTPQVARIDAHILNRKGAARLCYCGPVLHTQALGLHNTREPLQCGAELYGCSGIEADLEVLSLAVDTLSLSGMKNYRLALSHASLLEAVLDDQLQTKPLSKSVMRDLHQTLADKDKVLLMEHLQNVAEALRPAVLALLGLYGPALGPQSVLGKAQKLLPSTPKVRAILDQLSEVAERLQSALPEGSSLLVDLADLASFEYHSGLIFSAYVEGCPNAILRGGRYDDVGSVYGRARPATGFSVDLRELVGLQNAKVEAKTAIRAPFGTQKGLVDKVRQLRDSGEVVVQSLPGTAAEEEEFVCDRELVSTDAGWVVQAVRAI